MYRVESEQSIGDSDENIMEHLTEGGVTILKQLDRKRQVRSENMPWQWTLRSLWTYLWKNEPKARLHKKSRGSEIRSPCFFSPLLHTVCISPKQGSFTCNILHSPFLGSGTHK